MAESSRGKPRRPHHKSRTGCLQCKQRKVKCDETKPICTKCQGYKDSCSFLQTYPQTALKIPSPEPTIKPTSDPPAFSMLDMELLHFYTTTSVYGFVDTKSHLEVLRTTIVQLAFEHSFLMHEILSLAALHLAQIRRNGIYMHASDTHLAKAISLFQPEVTNLTSSNCHACFAFSTMIFTHAWVSQDLNMPSTLFFQPDDGETHIQWVKFHRGTNEILKTLYPVLVDGPLGELFLPWKNLDPDRPDPVTHEVELKLTQLRKAWESSKDKLVLEQALKQLRRVFSMLSQYPDTSKLAIVLAWFANISDEYLKLLEGKAPEAVLIATYYCVTLKNLESVWWMEGKAENLFRTLTNVLGDEWERWLTWPREKLGLSHSIEFT